MLVALAAGMFYLLAHALDPVIIDVASLKSTGDQTYVFNLKVPHEYAGWTIRLQSPNPTELPPCTVVVEITNVGKQLMYVNNTNDGSKLGPRQTVKVGCAYEGSGTSLVLFVR